MQPTLQFQFQFQLQLLRPKPTFLSHNRRRRSIRFLRSKCSTTSNSDSNNSGDLAPPPLPEALKDAMAAMVGEGVDQLLLSEENRPLRENLEAAERRVELACAALADIEREREEAMLAKQRVEQLEKRSSEIAEYQKGLAETRAKLEETECSLLSILGETGAGNDMGQEVDEDSERLESVKAAAVSSVIGTLASLPVSIYQLTDLSKLLVQLPIIFISSALFGVTFRYAVRRDLDNTQLKTGAPAAFAVVRGLSMLDVKQPLELSADALIPLALEGAVYVAENVFIFLSAAVALDFCFKMRLLSPFPSRK